MSSAVLRGLRVCLTAGLIMAAGATAASEIRLAPQYRKTPLCQAIAGALRTMPPSTDEMTWTARLPPIRGVTRPAWRKVDTSQHEDAIFQAYINYGWDEYRHPDPKGWDAHVALVRPEIEARIKAGIADGTISLEETSVPTIMLNAHPDDVRPMELYRVTNLVLSSHTIARTRPKPALGPRWILSIKSLPYTHAFDLRPINTVINTGVSSSMDVLIVAGRPLFIGMPQIVLRRYFALGDPSTGLQLASTRTDLPIATSRSITNKFEIPLGLPRTLRQRFVHRDRPFSPRAGSHGEWTYGRDQDTGPECYANRLGRGRSYPPGRRSVRAGRGADAAR